MGAQQGPRLRWTRRAVWSVVVLDAVLTSLVVVQRLPAGRMAASFGFGDLVAVLVEASFLVMGAVLALRRPDIVVAWILLAVGTLWPLWSVAFAALPGGWVPPIMLMGVQLLLRFPDGQLPSPRWRWFSAASWVLLVVATVVVSTGSSSTDSGARNPYFVAWTQPLSVLVLLVPVWILSSAWSLVVRYRRAGAVEREQIRWLAWAGSVIAILYALVLVSSLVVDSTEEQTGHALARVVSVLQIVTLASFTLIPIAVGIAILRFHLYEIDRIITRTASYTLVSSLVVAVFAGVVVLAGRLLPGRSQLSVAAATLAAAALVRPLLRVVQDHVDRRFNRERYDAQRTVDAFGLRLRHQVETTAVVADLGDTVAAALQPAHITLWLHRD
jgi:hypothetical protein